MVSCRMGASEPGEGMSSMMRILGLAVALGAALWAPLALGQAGEAVGVNPDASAVKGTITKTLVVGADVQVGERIVTGASGLVQIIFTDQTRLVVGPGSSLVIEQYLLRGGEAAEKLTINALSGTFRFATGKSPKPAYEIKTPTATIGVRGTGFDFTVLPTLTRTVVSHGAVVLCQGGQCVTIAGQCAMGESDSGEAQAIGGTQENIRDFRPNFPLLVNQNPLLRPFRFVNFQQCLNPETPAPAVQDVPDLPMPEYEPCDCYMGPGGN